MLLDALIFLAVTVACLAYGLAVPALVRRLIARNMSAETQELAASVGFRISVLYSLIIGILVASLVSEYADAIANSNAEAAEITRTDEALRLLETDQASLAREVLHDYAKSLITEEWPRVQNEAPHAATGAELRKLQLAVLELTTEEPGAVHLQQEVRERVSQLAKFRAQRFLSARTEGMAIFWLLGFVGFTALLIQFGYYRDSRPGHFIVGVFCVMQATIFFIVLAASNPFGHPGAISTEVLERSIEFR